MRQYQLDEEAGKEPDPLEYSREFRNFWKAETNAALAAVERVRAEADAYAEQPDVMEPCGAVAQALRTALDGAPETEAAEKKYAIEYSSKTRTSIHEQESLESARVELARIPHPNGRIMQQVVAPWLPVEGES